DASGDAFFEWLRFRMGAIGGTDLHAVWTNHEWHLIEHVRRAAVFEDADGANGHAVRDPLAEKHRAIRHKRHEAVPLRRSRPVIVHLGRYNPGQAVSRQPFVEPVKLATFRN